VDLSTAWEKSTMIEVGAGETWSVLPSAWVPLSGTSEVVTTRKAPPTAMVPVVPGGSYSKAPTSRGPYPGRWNPAVVGLGFSGLPRKSVVVATLSSALLIAAEVDSSPKLASRKNVAGPSDPGRGSRGAINAGYPVKLPRSAAAFAARGPSRVGSNPLPMFSAA